MATEIIDPVCGTHINPALAPFECERGDLVFYFCSDRCYQMFQQNPETYENPEFAGRAGMEVTGEECLIPGGAEGCK